jgi:enamine deaminase RidA (YjgF/YER057c/UK114 family)
VSIERLYPAGMHRDPAYTPGILIPAVARYVLVGGQNGVDGEGRVTGKGDLAVQTAQALTNVAAVLEAGGARPDDLVSLSVCLVGEVDLTPAFGAWMTFWGDRGAPPVLKVLRVAGLSHPDFLIEIEGLAAMIDPPAAQ